jgi:hypothetical protein
MNPEHSSRNAALIALALLSWTAACAPERGPSVPDPRAGAIARGRAIWLNNTYGGEKFFAFLAQHPDPARRVRLGFDKVLATPRDARFRAWGTINDPDCRANPAGGHDLCPDPHATGVVGIRKFAAGKDFIYGVACASCHVGFDPRRPPRDAAEPKWDDLHLTIGNPYLDTAAIFAANMAPDDPRRAVLAAWPKGTVDTTFLFNDGLVNPGAITPIWEWMHRPTFDVGTGEPALRNGQGGEDDLGSVVASMRVYTNIGSCFAECVAPRPGRPDASLPIDIEQCRRDCADFPPLQDLEDLAAFQRAAQAPRYPGHPRDGVAFARGSRVFAAECASCHVVKGPGKQVLSNDEVNPLVSLGENATNACRALTTNWESGHLWEQFSSSVYKARADAGGKGYRTMPLVSAWATTPFLHNNSIGEAASPTATPAQRAALYREAMMELLSRSRPLRENPLLCADKVENRGHYYGSSLSESDKRALIYWLQFQ